MTELALLVAWYLLGLAICIATGLGRRAALSCSVGFLVGMVAFLVPTILALGVGVPLTRWTAALLWIALLAAAVIVFAWRRPPLRPRALLLGSAIVILLLAAACSVNIANFTYDSHKMLAMARGVGYRGALSAPMWQELSAWGALLVVAQSMASLLDVSFLHSLSIACWLSLVATFAVGLDAAASELAGSMSRRRRTLLIAVVTIALASGFQFLHAASFIHNNLLSAALLFIFLLFLWLSRVSRDPSFVPIAFLMLAALAFARIETPFVAALFLVLAASSTSEEPDRRLVTAATVGFGLVAGTWMLLLALHLPSAGDFLTSTKAWLWLAVIAAATAHVVATHRSRRWSALDVHVAWLALAIAAAALVATIAIKPAHMATSAMALWSNVTDLWAIAAWSGAVGIAVLLSRAPALPFSRGLRVGAPLFVVLVLLLAFVRIPYRHSFWDSGNRMMLHILPVLYFYIGLKLIVAIRKGSPDPGA